MTTSIVDSGGRVEPQATATFDDFVAARSRALLRTAYLLTHDHALAEDLLQTSLTKAWFAWRRIDGQPEPYVRKILVNTYSAEPTDLWTATGHTDRVDDAGVALHTRAD